MRASWSVDDVSVSMVCRESGGSRSSLYNIFGSQDGYFLALHNRLAGDVREFLASSDLPLESGTPERRMESVLARSVAVADRRLWFVAKMHPLVAGEADHAAIQSELDLYLARCVMDALARRDLCARPGLEFRSELVAWIVLTCALRGTAGRVPFLNVDPTDEPDAVQSLARTLVLYLGLPPVEVPPSWVDDPAGDSHRASGAQVEDRILDAAEMLLVGRDSAGLTVLDVAIAAETSQSVLYAKFGSKRGLMQAVVDRLLDETFSLSQEVMRHANDGDERDVLRWVCRAYSLLLSTFLARLHVLAAFETPDRLGPGIGTSLADTESAVIDRAIEMLPDWVSRSERLADIVLTIRMSKLILQGAYVGPTRFGAHLGLDRGELIAELAAVSMCPLDLGAGSARSKSSA